MPERHLAGIESPWNHYSRRSIEAPVYRLADPNKNANFWRLELKQDGQRYVVESDKPVLDTIDIWPKLRVGSWIQVNLLEGDRATKWWVDNRVLGARIFGFQNHGLIAKAPDWEDHDEAPLDFAASVRRNLDWFDSIENNPRAFYREAGMPAWWWHAGEDSNFGDIKFEPGSFPSLASQAIRAYLLTAKACPERAAHCRQIARNIGDWLLKNRTPMTDAVPGMPYSAMREGKFEYSVDAASINLSRGAQPGYMMTLLFRELGDQKYLEYAQHIAETFLKFIRKNGSLPYRVKPATGEVVEEYTNGHTLVAIFLEALDQVAPDPRWREAATRIVGWVIENPCRDFHWKACFEDAWEFPKYASMASMDAFWAVRLLCRHGKVARARQLMRWVEDQFVSFGDEASLVVSSYYPCVREQFGCDFPMECHGANYAATCWELHKATGDATYRRKGIATLNAIVKSQRADGAYSTWGIDRETGFGAKGSAGNWFNTNHAAAGELCSFLLHERGEELPLF